MFSLHDPEVDSYFQRLNAPLRRMPSEERADLHAELRQHLDALLAAYAELGCTHTEAVGAALARLGNPRVVGRGLMREWRRTQRRAALDRQLDRLTCWLNFYNDMDGCWWPLLWLRPPQYVTIGAGRRWALVLLSLLPWWVLMWAPWLVHALMTSHLGPLPREEGTHLSYVAIMAQEALAVTAFSWPCVAAWNRRAARLGREQ